MNTSYADRITRSALPSSLLLKQLCEAADKENKLRSQQIDFVGMFNSFAEHVAPELSQTNLLFNEFTPHDEAIHISNLFQLTDELLGSQVIAKMNACECFLLACSLYGHDWGMAVSIEEKTTIETEDNASNLPLLVDEFSRLRQFLKIRHDVYITKIPLSDWQNYVRYTHAERARVRIEKYFELEGQSLFGEVLGDLCASHWYDIKDVQSLSNEKSVAGWVVNLRALSCFIRLIDMLDIAANRTPYKLWKFVNPKNNFSSLEWKKHRSLNPAKAIKLNSDSDNRKIVIQGSTDDHKIYASIIDLRSWCTNQFYENRDLLSKEAILDPKLERIEWGISARGFEPVEMRFEFERTSMFDVLSNEIYDDDQFVFLRELIQNSRDAIEVRKEYHKSRDVGMALTGKISITVGAMENGEFEVSVMDNGIGMTEHIIKNYLARIGSSYYGSSEFESLDFTINPISRFGVGILSCFMVADRIIIETQRDPQESESDGFRIEISDFQQQFRIARLPSSTLTVGTKVSIFVLKEKMHSYTHDDDATPITDYVSTIAEGVSSEIAISEKGKDFTVVPATANTSTTDDSIKGVSYAYNREQIFEPQELPFIDDFLEECSSKIDFQYKGTHVQGAISYFRLKTDFYDVRPYGFSAPGVSIRSPDGSKSYRLRHRSVECEKPQSLSGVASQFGNVYMNGILVPEANITFTKAIGALPLPRIMLEVSTGSVLPTLSRRGIKSEISFTELAKEVYFEEIKSLYGNKLADSDPRTRLLLIGEILTCFHVEIDEFDRILPKNEWPIIVLAKNGASTIRFRNDLPENSTTVVISKDYCWRNSLILQNNWGTIDWLPNELPESQEIIDQLSDIVEPVIVVQSFGNLIDRNQHFALSQLGQFLTKQAGSEVVSVKKITAAGRHSCVLIHSNIHTPTREIQSLVEINSIANRLFGSLSFAEILHPNEDAIAWIQLSSSPFDTHERTSSIVVNKSHDVGKELLAATNRHNKIQDTLSPVLLGDLQDAASSFPLKGVSAVYRKTNMEQSIGAWMIGYINKIRVIQGHPAVSVEITHAAIDSKNYFACYE